LARIAIEPSLTVGLLPPAAPHIVVDAGLAIFITVHPLSADQ
jgi:hypothetical protein